MLFCPKNATVVDQSPNTIMNTEDVSGPVGTVVNPSNVDGITPTVIEDGCTVEMVHQTLRREKMRLLFSCFLLAVSVMCAGCNKPSDSSINVLLTTGGQAASFYGFKEWKDDKAVVVAKALSKTIDSELIPYLEAGNLPTADIVNRVISTKLFNGLDERIMFAITTGAAALDALLPVPEATQYLTPAQVGHIKAFLIGVSSGCKKFVSGEAKVNKAPKYKSTKDRNWLYVKRV